MARQNQPLSRVTTSHLGMHFLQCVAFWKKLDWFIYLDIYEPVRVPPNAMQCRKWTYKRMCKRGLSYQLSVSACIGGQIQFVEDSLSDTPHIHSHSNSDKDEEYRDWKRDEVCSCGCQQCTSKGDEVDDVTLSLDKQKIRLMKYWVRFNLGTIKSWGWTTTTILESWGSVHFFMS